MPARKAPETILEVLQARARQIVDILEDYIDGPRGPDDPAAAATAIGLITSELLNVIPDLASAAAATAARPFLIPDGEALEDGQISQSVFFENVCNKVSASGAIPVSAVSPTVGSLVAFSAVIGLDPDTWVRWSLGFIEKVEVVTAEAKMAEAIIDFITPYGENVVSEEGETLPADFPSYDDSKEAQLVNATMPDLVAKLLKWTTARIPGGTEPSSRSLGQAVHKHLIAAYVADFPDHFVVADGRARVRIGPNKADLAVSRLFTDAVLNQWPVSDPNRAKLTTYWGAMRDPTTFKRVRPDIADLHDAAQGTNPENSWGWLEIKPLRSLHKAFQETYAWYMPLWNDNLEVQKNLPQWKAKPGTWQPPLLGVLRTRPVHVCAAVTVPPGCVGYLTVEVKDAALAAAKATVLTAMAAFLAKKIFLRLRQLYRDVDEFLEPVFILLGYALIAAVVLILFIEAALAVVTLEAVLAFLGLATAGGNLQQRLQQLATMLPTPA